MGFADFGLLYGGSGADWQLCGFEAVLGFLYLSERFDRLIEVTERAFQAIAKEIMSKRQGKG